MDVDRIVKMLSEYREDERFKALGPRIGELDRSGSCERPVAVNRMSRQHGEVRHWRKGATKAPMAEITIFTRCRTCKSCLAATSREWRNRAIAECDAASRTWFGTLTLNPDNHVAVDSICATEIRDFWELPTAKKFAARNAVVVHLVQKYLKRLRKQTGQRFRYLCVTERHDGARTSDYYQDRPHVHLLLHEFVGQTFPKRVLEEQWNHGFTSFKLADRAAAFYVSKYISKSAEVRVRASKAYGNTNELNESDELVNNNDLSHRRMF